MQKKVMGLVGLGALALVGGSWAYYSQTASLDNPFTTGTYENSLVEDFTPPTEDLQPGAEWDKIVGAKNTGDYPVLVRVKMEESWTRKGDNQSAYITRTSAEGHAFNSLTEQDGEWIAIQPNFDDTIKNGAADGLVKGTIDDVKGEDDSVVFKHLVEDSGWVDGGDGYWYWNGVLEGGQETGALMDKLCVASNIDMGQYKDTEYYAIVDEGQSEEDVIEWKKWENKLTDENEDGVIDVIDMVLVIKEEGKLPDGKKVLRQSESKVVEGHEGYSDSRYKLTITSQFVQATTDAVAESWGTLNEKVDNVVQDGDSKNYVSSREAL